MHVRASFDKDEIEGLVGACGMRGQAGVTPGQRACVRSLLQAGVHDLCNGSNF